MSRPLPEYHCMNLLFKQINDFTTATKNLAIWNGTNPKHRHLFKRDFAETQLGKMSHTMDWWLSLSQPRYLRNVEDKVNDFKELRRDIKEYHNRVDEGYYSEHIMKKIKKW